MTCLPSHQPWEYIALYIVDNILKKYVFAINSLKQARKPRSYASLKLRLTYPPTHRGKV